MRSALKQLAPAGLLLLALGACAQIYPFLYTDLSLEPITIGPEWTEIHYPESIVTTLPDKVLFLRLERKARVPNFHDKVVVREGERIELYAEVVDASGKSWPLPVWNQNSYLAPRLASGPYMTLTSEALPKKLLLTTVRLRSSVPLQVDEVVWTSSRNPGPPVSGPLPGRF